MRPFLAHTWMRLAHWLRPKSLPSPTASRGTSFVDAYRRHREPSAGELLAELKNTAWSCASINAAVCASFPPRLYVSTQQGQPAPKCLTRDIAMSREYQLRQRSDLALRLKGAERIEEVTDHPLLALLQQVNPVHNGFKFCTNTMLFLRETDHMHCCRCCRTSRNPHVRPHSHSVPSSCILVMNAGQMLSHQMQ